MELDENERLTASEAVTEFMQIYDSLTPAQLETPVDSRWTNSGFFLTICFRLFPTCYLLLDIRTKLVPERNEMYGQSDDEEM